MALNLADILGLETIRVPLVAGEKKAAIDELVDVMAGAGKVADAGSLKAAVWEREQTRTTGIGHSLAIPHGKCDSVDELAMAIGRPSEPIEFDSIDGKPVRLIVLLASPFDRTSDHIQALAQVSRLMASESFRQQVFEAESAEALYELIVGGVATRA